MIAARDPAEYRTDIAIASYPRSGSTWLRQLLYVAFNEASRSAHGAETSDIERAMGIAPPMADPSARFVKTHALDTSGWRSAIHLVRRPTDAIDSLAALLARTNALDLRSEPAMNKFLIREAAARNLHQKTWREARSCPILVVEYEDLCLNTIQSLRRIKDFLHLTPRRHGIHRAVTRHPRRPPSPRVLTGEQRRFLTIELMRTEGQ